MNPRPLIASLLRAISDWLLRGPACPACTSRATRRNYSARIDMAMLCDDCGCRWRAR